MPVLLLAAPSADDRHARATTALRVASWARERSDAGAMLAAARMLADAGVREADGRSAAIVLADEAVAMTPSDPAIRQQADAVRDAAPRGIIRGPLGDGPIVIRHALLAGATTRWPVQARGGTTTIVSAVGDGDADIDMRVTRGRSTVCSDVDRDPNPVCRWRAVSDATFQVALTNRGRLTTRVVLLSN